MLRRSNDLRIPKFEGIDHFGEISFAEVFAAFGTRTLTMLRLKLGSPQAANGTVVECTTNGQPMPPTPSSERIS